MSVRISAGKKWKRCIWQPDNKQIFEVRVSVFSRLNKVSWIADVFTPLAVILMECFFLYPWLVFIGKLPELRVQQTPLSLLSLIFLLGLSFVATRFFLKRKWPMPWIQTSIMACGLAAIFLVLRLDYSAGFQLFSRQWLREPIERNRFLRVPIVGSDLSGLTFASDGQRGWAVGDRGAILSTRAVSSGSSSKRRETIVMRCATSRRNIL